MNGAFAGESTTNLPQTSMHPLVAMKANGGASSVNLRVSPIHSVWNRYLESLPTF